MNQLSLFPELEPKKPYSYFPNFLNKGASDNLLAHCKTLKWQQYLTYSGIKNPRLECLYGGGNYSYGNQTIWAVPWTKELMLLMSHIALKTEYVFHRAFGNYYRNGEDSIGWHADQDLSMGLNPAIASLSLGQTRLFQIKDLSNNKVEDLYLRHGSLLLMLPGMQNTHLHRIPKVTKGWCGERINLTFRPINLS